jgi:hypothetical protein
LNVLGKLKKFGAEKAGTELEIELKLAPDWNCESKAWLAAAALLKRLPMAPGAIGPFPIVNALNPGAGVQNQWLPAHAASSGSSHAHRF